MKCPECGSKMRNVAVAVEGATQKVMSYQCIQCDYFEFDEKSGDKVVEEIKTKRISPLNIKQKIIKISHDRLGTYFNENIIRSLELKGGEEIYVTAPDKKTILINIKDSF